jgi:hypothetical protein
MARIGVIGAFPERPSEITFNTHDLPIHIEIDVSSSSDRHLEVFWKKLPGNLRRAAGWGAWYAAQAIFRAADDMVPHRSAATMESGAIQKTTKNFGKSRVSAYGIKYDTEYAWAIHENVLGETFRQPGNEHPNWKHKPIPPTKRGRQEKWLEKAMNEVSPTYEDVVGAAVQVHFIEFAKKARAARAAKAASAASVPEVKEPPRPVRRGFADEDFSSHLADVAPTVYWKD